MSRQVERSLLPPLPTLGEDGLEVAFEEGAGVLEVLFGVGNSYRKPRKRFVQDADNALLFGEWGKRDFKLSQRFASKVLNTRTVEMLLQRAIF